VTAAPPSRPPQFHAPEQQGAKDVGEIALTTPIGALLMTEPATPQSIGNRQCRSCLDNQLLVGGKVVGRDADPKVRLEPGEDRKHDQSVVDARAT
jgi:hypothetical protein